MFHLAICDSPSAPWHERSVGPSFSFSFSCSCSFSTSTPSSSPSPSSPPLSLSHSSARLLSGARHKRGSQRTLLPCWCVTSPLPFGQCEEVSSVYRRRALECHPDRHPASSLEHFQQIQHVHEVLSDPSRRAQYDRWKSLGLDVPFETWLATGSINAHWSEARGPGHYAIAGTQQDDDSRSGPEDLRSKFRDYQI